MSRHTIQLPDDVYITARELSAAGEKYQWKLGDFLCDVIDEVGRDRRPEIITSIAEKAGLSESTLRDRQSMAFFYPSEVREEFSMLTYSQFRACKAAGKRWREYAEAAALDMLSVRVIRNEIRGNGHEDPALWERRWDKMLDIAGKLLDDEEAPPGARLAAYLLVSSTWG